jgi:predicted RNA-binding protein YlqC (UPF0109 family)
MKAFLEYIAKELVDNTAEVSVTESEKDGKAVYELHVAQSEVGKLIGKKGQTAQSIRTILNAIAAKQGKRVMLEIVDPSKGQRNQ